MLDNIGVQLTRDQKDLVLESVSYYRGRLRKLNPESARTLEEIKLHLENEESVLVFVENTRPRFDMEEHLDVLGA
jgi:hypothetical protein